MPEILDFASLSGPLKTRKENKTKNGDSEGKVRVKTVAVFIKRQEPNIDKPLLHVTFRRTTTLGQREVFEVDPQDLHWTSRNVAVNEPRVWKANLLGGGRLLETYKSLTNDETIGAKIGGMKSRGRVCSEEFTVGKPIQRKPKRKTWPLLQTDKFVKDTQLGECIQPDSGLEYFERPRLDELFYPPKLLIKEREELPLCLFKDGGPLLFGHEAVGIKAPGQYFSLLEEMANALLGVRESFMFFAAFGPRYLTGRQSAVLKKDIMNLPYPKEGTLVFRGLQKHLRDD